MSDIVLVEGNNELNVQMVPTVAAPPGGDILEIIWREVGGEVWHPISEPMPWNGMGVEYYLGFRVKNTGRTASFKVGLYFYDTFGGWQWMYSPTLSIEAGSEGLIQWPLWWGRSGSESETFHLFSDSTEVDSMTVTITVA